MIFEFRRILRFFRSWAYHVVQRYAFKVGILFTMIALGFICAATLLGYAWKYMSPNVQVAESGRQAKRSC